MGGQDAWAGEAKFLAFLRAQILALRPGQNKSPKGAPMVSKETHLSFSAKLVCFFLTGIACLLLAIAVYARVIMEDPKSAGFPVDTAFKGSVVLAFDQTLPAKCGDTSLTMTVSGVQFSFQTTRSSSNGGLFNCFPPGPAGQLNSTLPIIITISPPVSAVGAVAVVAECIPKATFIGSQGTEVAVANWPFVSANIPVFLGAADIGPISTITLAGTCNDLTLWSQMLFVPAAAPSAQADVAVNKSASPSVAGAAALLNYSISVTNNGPDTAKSVTAADFLPTDVTINATSPAATPTPPTAPTILTWSLGDLANGGNSSLSVFATTPPFEKYSCEDTLLNIAAVGASTADPNLANNVTFTATPFDKASRAGVAEICNNGIDDNCNGFVDCNDPACNTICNPIIAPVPGVGGGGAGGTRGTPGNCTSIDGQTFPPVCCDPYQALTHDECFGGPLDPNRKEANPPTNVAGYGYAQAGQTITYTIHYENIGTADAHNVSILDPLHPNLDETTLAINNAGVYDPATRVIVWHDPLTLPPQVPRSVSFSVNVKTTAQPGTRVRNRGTVVFPDASVPRTDTNFVEHTVLDPRFPVVAALSVRGCSSASPGSNQLAVTLDNKGFGFAYNVTADVINPPASVQVSNPLVHFVHPGDLHPDVLATVMPLSTAVSTDTIGITTAGHDDEAANDSDDDPCGVLTWRIRYTTSTGQMLSQDQPPSIDRVCPCGGPVAGGPWANHGAYVSCVSEAATEFVRAGLIGEAQRGAIVSGAAQSSCGK